MKSFIDMRFYLSLEIKMEYLLESLKLQIGKESSQTSFLVNPRLICLYSEIIKSTNYYEISIIPMWDVLHTLKRCVALALELRVERTMKTSSH